MKTGYFQFDAGINYRDDNMGINELRDGKNIYWRGNLKRRLGYEQRNQSCTSPSTGQYPTTGMQLIDHIKFDDGTTVVSLLFMSLADTGGATNAITVFQSSGGLPTGTGTTYTPIGAATWTQSSAGGVGQIIPWSTTDPFSVTPMDDKIWIALGDANPYVLFHDGTSWTIHEYPLCQIGNTSGSLCTGSTDGYNIIPGSTDAGSNEDWSGAKMVGAANNYLHVSDGRTDYYAQSKGKTRPDYGATYTGFYDRTSAVRISSTTLPGTPGWEVGFYYGFEEQLHLTEMNTYKKYLFIYGEDGMNSVYIRGLYKEDYDLTVETQVGVYGDVVACEKGIFFVGKDGIYGFDSETATDLAKKVWSQVESEHTTIPDDLTKCSLAYHDGFIWVSFPSGTNSEVYVFDPDHIYGDEYGDSHAPMYRFAYTNTTGRTAFGFDKIKEYDNHLYGIHSTYLYELDVEGLDAKTTSSGIGINFDIKTGYVDQEAPNLNKVYRKVIPEFNEGIADGTTDGAYDLQVACSVNHSIGVKFRGISTGIDLEYSTDAGHVAKTLDIPETTDGYVLDGNSISVELIGETTNVTPTTGDVDIFGFSLDYDVRQTAMEEVSS